MANFYDIERLLSAPLAEALSKLYPAKLLLWLHDVCLQNSAPAPTGAPPQTAGGKFGGGDRAPKKQQAIELLVAVLGDKETGRRFFDALPRAARDAIAAVTWEKTVNLAALEKAIAGTIATPNPDKQRIYYEPLLFQPEHGFLLITYDNRNDRYGYCHHDAQPKKELFVAVLPDALRKSFQTFIPPPPDYRLIPLDDIPANLLRYACDHKAPADLRLTAEFIAQGHMKYTKSERVATSSLRSLCQITGGPEFFPQFKDDNNLELLRTRLVGCGLAFVGEKALERFLAQTDGVEPVRELFETLSARANFLHEELLGHLGSAREWYKYSPHATKALLSFFRKLPAAKWVSFQNIRRYHTLREQTPNLFDAIPCGYQGRMADGKDPWAYNIQVHANNMFDLVSAPLLKGAAFLLAAFGMAEIAYVLPQSATYRRSGKNYLTPFDGLQFVRLTPLGEYVLGLRDTCAVADAAPSRAPIILDEARLLATCQATHALTDLALGKFMEKIAPNRYRLTPESLLCGCGTRQKLEERIRLFRRVVSAKPPPIWERFFEKTLARIAPLKLEPDYIVLKIDSDEEIRRLFTSDPVLREISLKVEGLRIAVRREDFRKLAKRLEQFGYLIPVSLG